MTPYEAFFTGKRVTVMGLGLLGRGVGDIRFIALFAQNIIVTDLKSGEELQPSLTALEGFKNITYTLGRHELSDFEDRDLIIQAAGVPFDSTYITYARKNGIPVTMSTALFGRFARGLGAILVGITGTRGKTTTTEMVGHILRAANRTTLLGGNIRGVSTLALLPRVKKDTVCVLELDSWQLQGFGEEKLSPDIAAFTSFYPDHLNYYKGDLKMYLSDKSNIFKYQRTRDTLVLGSQAALMIEESYGGAISSHIDIARDTEIERGWNIRMPGQHNRANAACALHIARALGVPDRVSRAALGAFAPVAGRLQFLQETGGVRIYNDTTSTTPEATIAALQALQEYAGDGIHKNIVLIMGGADKNLDMSQLVGKIKTHCKKVFLLAGSGTERIKNEFEGADVFDSLKSAVEAAFAAASPGDYLLFSPAFASFGMFKNEYDRGDQFVAVLKTLA